MIIYTISFLSFASLLFYWCIVIGIVIVIVIVAVEAKFSRLNKSETCRPKLV